MSLTFIWRNSKNDGNDNFREGFGHYTEQNRSIKGDSSGSHDSNELDMEELKAAQRNKLVVSGQNICRHLRNEGFISGLGLSEAF